MVDIINSRMFAALKGFYPSECTIQEPTEIQDDTGHPVASWSDLAGHVNMPCRLSPISGRAGEIRTPAQTYTEASHVVELTRTVPDVTTKMRAVVDGVIYDIVLIEHDGQGVSARILTELVT